MDAEELFTKLETRLKSIASKRQAPHPFLSAEDLLQQQALAILELAQKRPDLTGDELLAYAVTTAKNAVGVTVRSALGLRRKQKALPCISLNQEVQVREGENGRDKKYLFAVLSDGSYEKFREKLELAERWRLLRAKERWILREFKSPSAKTLEAYEEEVDNIRHLKLAGRSVHMTQTIQPEHVALGLKIPLREVDAALSKFRSLCEAA